MMWTSRCLSPLNLEVIGRLMNDASRDVTHKWAIDLTCSGHRLSRNTFMPGDPRLVAVRWNVAWVKGLSTASW
jgi:hypothetical protein